MRIPPDAAGPLDRTLGSRLDALWNDAAELWQRFDRERRQHEFHPFMPAQYGPVLDALAALGEPAGRRFLEFGSATGVIAIMADMLGFEACGIELDGELVDQSRELATRHGSAARFAAGSFLPEGYEYRSECGDTRMGTLGEGEAAYGALGLELADFDIVFGFPWPGEEPILHDLMRRYGKPDAILLVNGAPFGVKAFRNGEPLGL